MYVTYECACLSFDIQGIVILLKKGEESDDWAIVSFNVRKRSDNVGKAQVHASTIIYHVGTHGVS